MDARKQELEGVEWYKKAAAARHPDALYNLALIYYEGRIVETDMDKFNECLNLAAELDDPQALFVLGGQMLAEEVGICT
jgi:TPR repeat protein